jgi:hypothetical protein
MNSLPYSQYWAALVECSDEDCGRGRDIYIAPSAAELLLKVSSAVIGHYLMKDYDDHEEYQLAKNLVIKDLESLEFEEVPKSICGDWYDFCCDLQGFRFGDTNYAFVEINGPIYQFVQELLSVEQELFDAVEVKTRRQQEWFNELVKIAS